jgi:hypothetical protein
MKYHLLKDLFCNFCTSILIADILLFQMFSGNSEFDLYSIYKFLIKSNKEAFERIKINKNLNNLQDEMNHIRNVL